MGMDTMTLQRCYATVVSPNPHTVKESKTRPSLTAHSFSSLGGSITGSLVSVHVLHTQK